MVTQAQTTPTSATYRAAKPGPGSGIRQASGLGKACITARAPLPVHSSSITAASCRGAAGCNPAACRARTAITMLASPAFMSPGAAAVHPAVPDVGLEGRGGPTDRPRPPAPRPHGLAAAATGRSAFTGRVAPRPRCRARHRRSAAARSPAPPASASTSTGMRRTGQAQPLERRRHGVQRARVRCPAGERWRTRPDSSATPSAAWESTACRMAARTAASVMAAGSCAGGRQNARAPNRDKAGRTPSAGFVGAVPVPPV